MNSLAYVCTLEFIFAESAEASRISKIGLPIVLLIIKTIIVHVPDNFSDWRVNMEYGLVLAGGGVRGAAWPAGSGGVGVILTPPLATTRL